MIILLTSAIGANRRALALSLAVARAVFEGIRDEVMNEGLGKSELGNRCGDVLNGSNKKIANISWNGRIWGLGGKELTA